METARSSSNLSKNSIKHCFFFFFTNVYVGLIKESNLNYIFVINLFFSLGIDALILRSKIKKKPKDINLFKILIIMQQA